MKKQEGGFLDMLLETLCASMLGSILTVNDVKRTER